MSKVQNIFSNVDDTMSIDLLAVIVRADYSTVVPGTEFCTEPENPLQVGVISRKGGSNVEPHKHKNQYREINVTHEVLFIRRGIVFITIYDHANREVTRVTLGDGDVILLMSGHSLEFVDDSEIVEVKQGPYTGQDKQFIR